MTGMGVEVGAQAARARALAVLRIRGRAVAVAVLPAAVAVVLLAGGSTGHLVGLGWDIARWTVGVLALLVLPAAAGFALIVARSRPAVSPTVPITEAAAPDLYRLVRDLADRLDVPAPSAIALTPDCDSWLEDRTHPAHGPPRSSARTDAASFLGRRTRSRAAAAPVLVIGSPFLWWMRVGELRAVLAPVVAGTGPSAHPDIAAARRFVRGLDAAVAAVSTTGRRPVVRTVCAGVGWLARLLLHGCREHAAQMERGVAAAAAERAQAVDYGLRIVAQEQVGLAYAGWDRLLTRVALPAWRMGRWPSRLDAGVVAALTELSRRDRLAEGFASRLGERPACDLLEEPGSIDEATSLLAARLFHGGPAESGPTWSPVDWQEYPDEVVDRKWRTDAARLHRVLDTLGVRRATRGADGGPTLSRVLDHLSDPAPAPDGPTPPSDPAPAPDLTPPALASSLTPPATGPAASPAPPASDPGRTLEPGPHRTPEPTGTRPASESDPHPPPEPPDPPGPPPAPHSPTPFDGDLGDGDLGEGALGDDDLDNPPPQDPRCAALADGLSAEMAREEEASGASHPAAPPAAPAPDIPFWDGGALPLFPLQPPRTPRELLADHVTAMVCCAAIDTVGATPALDWLDGPSLLVNGERATDLTPRVLSLIEDGDPAPLRTWLAEVGIRPEKPVRLV
ncbi:hypothetical protein DN051_20725 [Streptomyces cadmiisoli]|uniref:Uncharacterized protein n=2 Tax=Streptomyces cadmiisoli TaxID=2184053 RepID=A0A2Z4J196_9ACTN|nr:hypothetical protein DN051_20725 [Streptomyces cadmiisoli]